MRKLALILLLLVSTNLWAQNRLSEYNQIGWYALFITPKISNKVSAHIEYQWRREAWIKNWQQSLPRVGINYKVNNNITLQAGYAWIFTYPYGNTTLAAIPKTFPEHRLYQQITVSRPVGKTNLSHRLRLEERWLGKYTNINSTKPDEWVYVNRIRYMPRLDIPFNKKLYAAAYDEILIGFGKKVGENIFDQNRMAFMLGYKWDKHIRTEAGYLNQTLQLGREINNKNLFQHNNGLVINTYLTL
ncbi:DUF2490 domain-containing protein [Limnovirga soli]|uniref:DUF2490 domain-containing protein n=1 Tax=Limnovirga soli TaxID=2656915 RepID=A0A8J8FHH6_9BACT|nr:DUF2490 domain-containing protein [Limnovirga soli]NNV56459.1 DUF2490 domain-containing protein [Limnovirga soli]